MAKMRAIQIMEPNHAEVVEIPIPEPPPGEVLVRVIGVATCPQWDLHLMAVGDGVASVKVGDRVSAWRDQGHDRQGCYAEYVLMLEDNILPVPPDINPRRVVSLELAMCMASSILKLKNRCGIAGKRAAVNGLGPAGFVAGQMLRAEGAASVVGFEVHPGRRLLAEKHAVDKAFDPFSPEVEEAFPLRSTGRPEIDIAVDCVGYPDPMRFLADRTALAIAEFAVQRGEYQWTDIHDGLEFLSYDGHGRNYAEYALALILDDRIDISPTLSVELPLEQYTKGVTLLRRKEAMKVLFSP